MTIDHVNALSPGTRFVEYRLDAVLGAGGFGITYRAYDANLDKFVAIKEYLPVEFATRTEASTVVPHSNADAQDFHWGLTRFLDEARTLARFNHPHLNRVHRFFESNGTAYMVLEYINGETLADRLSREPYLEEADLQRLLDEVLSGLEVMHEAGYVHRDIKPGNLMLRAEDGSAMVLDFGAARQAVGQRSKPITSILTPGYAPIEQYDSKADDVGPWSDIYALGMVAYRCISGLGDNELQDAVARMLAHTKGGTTLLPAVEAGKGRYNPKLLEAIDWAMEVDEEDRPQSVEAWRQALTGGSRRKSPPESVRKPATRPTRGTTTERTGISWLGVALTVVIVVLLGVGAWWGWQEYPELFGRGAADVTEITEQKSQADVETTPPLATEIGDTLTTAEQTPLVDDILQPAPAKAAPVEEDEVTRLLLVAEADLKARRLTSPAGNNAWDRYQQVLALEPSNQDAIAGMERVIESYRELFGTAVEQEEFDKASGYLTRIRDLHPDSPVLEEGEKRLEAARQAHAARMADIERQRIAQASEAHWAAFDTALAEENLSEAAGILAEVRDLNPDAPRLAEGERRLAELERKRQEAEVKARQFAGEMVSIPGGTFNMGDLRGVGEDDERPVHSVTLPTFRIGKYEVTFTQWDACVADGGCGRYRPKDEGWGRGNRPVINISWDNAQSFIDWLNAKTSGNFRLPTEAEWEYAARAGSTTMYHFGEDESQLCRYANHADSSTDYDWRNRDCSDGVDKRTADVGRYQPNKFGLYDMHGNAWEWVEDCWKDNHISAPTDGKAWVSGDCSQRVIRGGSWASAPWALRSSNRYGDAHSYRLDDQGFRVAQD